MQIANSVAMVTGGGSGLGAATARHLASRGAKVAVVDMNVDGAQKVAVEIGGIAIGCDVADDAAAQAAVAEARAAHGPARILVTCAGISEARLMVGRDGPAPLGEHRRVLDTHVVGTYNFCRLIAADLVGLEPLDEGERGVMVNTASIAGYDGPPGAVSYAAAKAAIAAMTLPMARELGRHGIRVAAIAPGVFETPMVGGLDESFVATVQSQMPFPHRLGRPDEYARMVETIVTTPMLNGEVIRLDAGFRMRG
jgi:NAD(P)-dependent dehydrogenase (short-subunit alcohol dehydrogenase family)